MEFTHGFFESRHAIKLSKIAPSGKSVKFAEYVNVPRNIGYVISQKMATLYELQNFLGTQDLYDLLEIIKIDNHNQALMRAK